MKARKSYCTSTLYNKKTKRKFEREKQHYKNAYFVTPCIVLYSIELAHMLCFYAGLPYTHDESTETDHRQVDRSSLQYSTQLSSKALCCQEEWKK